MNRINNWWMPAFAPTKTTLKSVCGNTETNSNKYLPFLQQCKKPHKKLSLKTKYVWRFN